MSHELTPDLATQTDFTTAEASTVLDDDGSLERSYDIDPHDATILGLPFPTEEPASALTKTVKFHSTVTDSATGELLATIDQANLTVTKMTVPTSGAPFLFVAFSYLVTSVGNRTGRGGSTGEPLGASHGLFFLNNSGGIMYSWGFPADELIVHCGWNREPRYHVVREYNFVSWFDIWNRKLDYRINGAFWGC